MSTWIVSTVSYSDDVFCWVVVYLLYVASQIPLQHVIFLERQPYICLCLIFIYTCISLDTADFDARALVSVAATAPRIYPYRIIPVIIAEMASILSRSLYGVMSPYPTVVIVVVDQYSEVT